MPDLDGVELVGQKYTHKHTHRQTEYHNPSVHVPKVKYGS